MSFRQRALMAAALLVCLPTAIWAVHGGVGLSSGDGGGGGDVVTLYGETHEYDNVPHGVDVGRREPLRTISSLATIPPISMATLSVVAPMAHPHGKSTCASGCASDQHPTPPLRGMSFAGCWASTSTSRCRTKAKGSKPCSITAGKRALYMDHLDKFTDAEKAPSTSRGPIFCGAS